MAAVAQHPSEHQLGLQSHSPSSSMHQVPADELPSKSALETCSKLSVCDKNNTSVPFEKLYETNGSSRRTLIILVRHFYCGLCQDYLRALSSSISKKQLASLEIPTDIKIIGCGSPDLIKDYASRCHCDFPMYADHTRKLYDTLGMTSTLDLGAKPDYQSGAMVGIVGASLLNVLSSPLAAMKGGSYSQVGGELLFQDGKVVWCHRMRTTRDHTEIEDLRKILGLS